MLKNEEVDFIFKIITLGETGVGKTCFLYQYVENQFLQSCVSTIGIDYKLKILTINDKTVKLKIWDTAGQERFRNVTQQFYKNADGILLLFALNDKSSFYKISDWMKQIYEHIGSAEIPIVLIGNKDDLEREISPEECKQLAKKYNLNYYETSAKNGKNVNASFECLANEIFKIKYVSLYRKDFNRDSATHKAAQQFTLNNNIQVQQRDENCCW